METIYLCPLIFLVVASLFAMIGLGGSQLYIPILFWLGMDFKTQAIPLGMLLNVVNSSSAAWTYGRQQMIEWKVAVPFGIFMILVAPVGTWINVNLPTKPIVLIFALFTASAGLDAQWLETKNRWTFAPTVHGVRGDRWQRTWLFCRVDRARGGAVLLFLCFTWPG
jgi:hypothetical protein